MPETTPIYGFPYPLDNDPVHQGAAHIRNIARKLEATLNQEGTQPAGTELVEIARRLNALEQATADTDWQPIPLPNGLQWRAGYEGRVRRRGPIVNVLGQLQTSQSAWNSAGVRLQLPVGFRPDGETRADQMLGVWINAWYRPNGELYTHAVSQNTSFIINAQFFIPAA